MGSQLDERNSFRVFMGGLLRDSEATVGEIVAFTEAARDALPELEVFIFENNSRDRTADLLAEAAASRPYLHARSEIWDLDGFRETAKARTWDNKCCRIEVISAARNTLLDWMWSSGLTSDDRVVMIDWDFVSAPPSDLLARWLQEMPDEADGLFANGVNGVGQYYDLYEIRTPEHPLGPELLGDDFWYSKRRNRNLRRVIEPTEPLIECYSAFGGLSIYRADALAGCRYSAYPTEGLHTYYQERFRSDPGNSEVRRVRRAKIEKVHAGALMGAYLFDDEIFYRNNSGFNFPIAAEHVNLHLAMRARGRGRFFIVPGLRYLSSH